MHEGHGAHGKERGSTHVSESKPKHNLQDVVEALRGLEGELAEQLVLACEQRCREEAVADVQNRGGVHVQQRHLGQDLLGKLDGALGVALIPCRVLDGCEPQLLCLD